MNQTASDLADAANEYRAEADQCIRRNTGSAILVALGAGVAIGLLVRALRPALTPQDRLARLIEDLECRLRNLTGPVLRKASALAGDGLHAAHDGEARVEHFVSDAARRVRRFFS